MKKNISFIPMDSILSKWLYDKLKREPPETACVDAVSYTHLDVYKRQAS